MNPPQILGLVLAGCAQLMALWHAFIVGKLTGFDAANEEQLDVTDWLARSVGVMAVIAWQIFAAVILIVTHRA